MQSRGVGQHAKAAARDHGHGGRDAQVLDRRERQDANGGARLWERALLVSLEGHPEHRGEDETHRSRVDSRQSALQFDVSGASLGIEAVAAATSSYLVQGEPAKGAPEGQDAEDEHDPGCEEAHPAHQSAEEGPVSCVVGNNCSQVCREVEEWARHGLRSGQARVKLVLHH